MNIGFEGIEDDRTKWEEYRRGRTGSSQVGTILGLNKYVTPYQLFAQQTGRISEEPPGDAALYGSDVERAIQKLWARRNPEWEVEDCQTTYEHQDYPWAIASPDSWIIPHSVKEITDESTGEVFEPNGARGILECKHTAVFSDDWDGGIPDVHHAQVQWQLGVCNIEYAYVAAVVGGRAGDLKSFFVKRDRDLFDTILEKVLEFRRCVENDTPPEAVGADIKLLDQLSDRRDQTIELEPGYLDVLKQYDDAKAHYKELQAEADQWKRKLRDSEAQIRQAMSTANRAITPDGRMVTLKKVVTKEHVRKESVSWRFNLKEM